MKNDYSKLADFIIENVGGKENITHVEHCTTRLRFKLNDVTKANKTKLEGHDGISGVTQNSGQYQVIIGMDVPNVYKAVEERLNGIPKKWNQGKEKKKASLVFTDFVTGVMSPVITYMIACGLITGISFFCIVLGILDFNSSIYTFLSAVGNSMFYFFPFILGYNVTKYLDLNPVLGLVLAAILCHPSINGVDLDFFGYGINVTYTSTFLPIIFTCLIAKPIYLFFDKILPTVIRSFVSVMFTILIAGSLGFLFIGPITNVLSDAVCNGILALYEISPIVSGVILGGAYEILVLFGLHGILGLITMNNIIGGTPDVISGLVAMALYACMFTVLAMAIKSKDKKNKSNYIGAFISSIFGVTEPIIYGPLLTNINMFAVVCVGGAIGGVIGALFNFKLHSYAGMGIIGLLGLVDPNNPSSIFQILITVAIVGVSSFVLAFLFYKEKKTNNVEAIIYAPVKGKMKPLSEISDDAFRGEYLGKTVAISPDEGKVYAPFNGQVKAVFPTKHAIGIESDDGCEMLIHIGIDTIKLEGKSFTCYVKEGDFVEKGQLMIDFDIDEIKNAGYSSDVLVIITNSKNYPSIQASNITKLNNKVQLLSIEMESE